MVQMINRFLPAPGGRDSSGGRTGELSSTQESRLQDRYVVEITSTDTRCGGEKGESVIVYSSARSNLRPGGGSPAHSPNLARSQSSLSQGSSFDSSASGYSHQNSQPNPVSFVGYLQLSRDSFFEGLHQEVLQSEGGAKRDFQYSTSSVNTLLNGQMSQNTVTPPGGGRQTGAVSGQASGSAEKPLKPSKVAKMLSPLIALFSGGKDKSGSAAKTPQESPWYLAGDDVELAILQQYIQW